MKAKLISYSQAPQNLQDEDKANPDLLQMIAYCARVSNPSNQNNSETAEKLVRYLIKHKHWSPLEMVNVCLEIETTRDIAHQIVRHRSFAFQEFSQRYANPQDLEETFVLRDARLQDHKNRQNSIEVSDNQLQALWEVMQQEVILAAKKSYDWAIENGIAKEQARAVLPEGLTKTRLYMNGSLRSWIHYIELRSANGTQKEHMDVARECAKVIANVFPMMDEYVGNDIA